MSVPVDERGCVPRQPESGAFGPARGSDAATAVEPGAPRQRGARDWGSNATLLTAVTVIISLGNYAYSFLVLHLLGARAFSRFGAAQGLLLVIGSGGMAAIPWAMARFIAERPDPRARREAMHFGILASTLQGCVFAAVTGAILWSTAGPGVGALGALSAFVCSVIAVPVGFLQGLDRIRAITGLRLLEFVTRCSVGVLILVLVGRSAPAALIGYPIGATVLIVGGFVVCRSGLPPLGGAQATIRALARQSLGLGAIQVFLAMLGSLDSVSALAAHLGSRQTAGYQSVAVLGRIPLFMSAAIGLAAYVHVVNARTDSEVRAKMGQAVRLYSLVAVPFVVACLTAPDALIHVLIPSRYTDAPALLRFTAVSGAAVGWIDVISTAHQARGAFRPAIRILGAAAIAQPIVLICAGRVGGVWWFAAGLVAVSLVAAVVLTVNARAWLVPHVSPRAAAVAAVALAGAILAHGIVPAWIGLIAVVGLVSLRALSWELRPVSHTAESTHPPVSRTPHLTAPTVSDSPDPLPLTVNDLDLASGDLMLIRQPQFPTLTTAPSASPPPRVVILGDSWIHGLGVRPEQAFGELAADRLGAVQVLNLSGVSLSTQDMVDQADLIREFAPTLAICCCGPTESLVHPGPLVRNAIDRWGPRSWRGLTGLEPRAHYSADSRKRLRQHLSVALKNRFKRGVIALTGGRRRISLAETRDSMDALITLLGELDTRMVFTSLWKMDEKRFPGTAPAFDETESALRELLHGRPDTVLVEVRDALHYWDDFLKDNAHLAVQGHQRVAELVVTAARSLLATSALEREPAGDAPSMLNA